MDLSVLVPIYNEEEVLPELRKRLVSVLDGMGVDYEIIFINDGSHDRSPAKIKAYAEAHPSINYIDLSRNFGHQIAICSGLDLAAGDAVVIIDGDLQDPPELISKLYDKYKEGYRVVYAQRKARKGESWFKKVTAKLFYRILHRLTDISIPLDTGDFRIVDRSVVEVIKRMPEQQKFLRGQIAWVGFEQVPIVYDRPERHAGDRKYTIGKLFKLALDGITSFSDFPLRFATMAGFAVSFIAFLLMLWALYGRFVKDEIVRGWPSLMISILFIGGIQLIVLGILGEYISRISANINHRPLYVIKDTNIKPEKTTLRESQGQLPPQ